ncbi:phosphatidate cytidylyltransferase [Balamuthia mandrillaris]
MRQRTAGTKKGGAEASKKGSTATQPDAAKKKKAPAAPQGTDAGTLASKVLKRTIFGALLVFMFAFLLYLGHFWVSLLVVLIQTLVFREVVSLRYKQSQAVEEEKGKKLLPLFRTINYYFLLTSYFWIYGEPLLDLIAVRYTEYAFLAHYHLWLSFSLYVIGFVGFVLSLKKGYFFFQFQQFAWTLMTLGLVVVQSSVIINNIYEGLFWLLLPHSLIICNDIMAYFCGLALGRRFIKKKLTKLSPNKTWEGFIGAAIFTLLFAFYFSGLLSQYNYFICPKVDLGINTPSNLECTPDEVFLPHSYVLPPALSSFLRNSFGVERTQFTVLPIQLHSILFALFASIIAPFGGFFASGLKRAFSIKDFDSIIPGHGGVTDRMDCQMITGLCVYVHLRTFIKPAAVTVGALLGHAAMLPRPQLIELRDQLDKLIQGRI